MVQLTFFPQCEVSKPLLALNVVQAVIFFGLFLNFFLRSYQKKRQDRKDKKESTKQNSIASCPKKLDDQDTNGYVRFRTPSVQKLRYVDVVAEAVPFQLEYSTHNFTAFSDSCDSREAF